MARLFDISVGSFACYHSGPSSPLPTTVRAFIFSVIINSAFSSLVISRGIVPTHAARRSQQLILYFLLFAFLQILKSNLTTVGIELKDQR